MGYRPQGCKESDTTERLNFNFSPAVPLAASYFINQESSLPRDFALCLEHSSLRCCVANSLTSSRTFLKHLITEAYSTTLLKMMISLSSLVNFITFLCFVFLHSTYSLLILYVIDLIIYCLSSLLKCKPQEGRDFCLLYSLPYSKCLKLCLAYSKCSININ